MTDTFRVLDLGACDGGVPIWLHQQHPNLHVDGLDLDHKQIALAAARAKDAGLPGRFVCDNALHAERHFPPHSYDAVVAFELIEHIADPTDLLDVCERMVKPDGQIFISTPDGCFGLGGNPHHLHAIRSIDLADLLRTRGQLTNMTVGSDGVSVASYTPREKREHVAIYTGPNWNRWAPQDIETKGLGGSETAAVRVASELSKLGLVVTVYGETDPACVADVIYRHHTAFDPLDRRDAVICSRIPEIADRPINAGYRALWVHDIDLTDRLTQARLDVFDDVYAVSAFHQAHLAGRYPFAADKIVALRNGIHHGYFKPLAWEGRAQRVVYTSSPDRGLDILLDLWPRVLEKAPDAELCFAYPDVYDAVADQRPDVAAHRDIIRRLSDQPGVHRLGALSQPNVARLLCESRVWAHPSYMTMYQQPFLETSCIAAMEAQAAGCHVVASHWGALPETVRYGSLVNNGPLTDRWKDGFVAEIVRGLTDQATGDAAMVQAPAAVTDLGWDGVALDIARMIRAAVVPAAT